MIRTLEHEYRKEVSFNTFFCVSVLALCETDTVVHSFPQGGKVLSRTQTHTHTHYTFEKKYRRYVPSDP